MDYEDQDEEQEAEVASFPVPPKIPSPAAPPLKPRYKECQKNHAVGIGAHAVDGCGEFLPAGDDGSLESLKCAACGCHRNFHRREPEAGGGAAAFPFTQFPHHQHQHQQQLLLAHHPHGHFGYRSPTGYLHVAAAPATRPAALALPSSSGGGGGGSREEMEDYYSTPGSAAAAKKRHRTKFTSEQKDKMLSLAERLDWKIQKQDEESVQQFCGEVGIKRHVLKVWMHNNKHTLEKPEAFCTAFIV